MTERIHDRVCCHPRAVQARSVHSIEGLYNPRPLHSALGYISPAHAKRRAGEPRPLCRGRSSLRCCKSEDTKLLEQTERTYAIYRRPRLRNARLRNGIIRRKAPRNGPKAVDRHIFSLHTDLYPAAIGHRYRLAGCPLSRCDAADTWLGKSRPRATRQLKSVTIRPQYRLPLSSRLGQFDLSLLLPRRRSISLCHGDL